MSFNQRWYAFGRSVYSDCLYLADLHAQDSQADANASGEQPSSIPSPRPPPKSEKAQPNLPKPQKPNRDIRGTKHVSNENAGPNKRRKTEILDLYGTSSKEEGLSMKLVSKPRKGTSGSSLSPEPENYEEAGQISKDVSANSKANGRRAEVSGSEMSEVLEEAPKTKGRKRTLGSAKPSAKANGAKADTSDSEMSEVLDEAPKPKGRKRKSDSAKPSTKTEILKRKKSLEQSTDPEAEEIKRLQGWLIRCGIRKMWHKELAPYDTCKAKISHLKKLLADAGMTGRYSVEKANQIKDDRELQAELEAVQEGAKQWGKAETEGEDENSGRPKRRLARGLQELDFLNDEDGEETD